MVLTPNTSPKTPNQNKPTHPPHKRQTASEADKTMAEEGLSFMYYVNDGVYGSFNCLLFDHAQAFPKVLSARGRPVRHQKDTVRSVWVGLFWCLDV